MRSLLSSINEHTRTYKSFLRDKSIAIVGPAASVMYEENGSFIDSFDVVVRINRGMELTEDESKIPFIGTRTDVLYNSLDFDPLCGGILNESKFDGLKFICCPYPVKERTFKDRIFYNNSKSYFEKYKIRFISEELYLDYASKANSRLNSGFGAILDIVNISNANVYITGIDFYRSVYQNGYNEHRNWGNDYKKIENDLEFKIFDDISHHNPDRQYEQFKELVKSNKRIDLDVFMKRIINDERYDNWETIPRE